MDNTDMNQLVKILATEASSAPIAIGAKGFMANLIEQTNWPDRDKQIRKDGLTGVADYDSRALIKWAKQRGTLEGDPRYTYLGNLLELLMENVGLEDKRWIATIISIYQLYRDDALDENLRMRYQIPRPVNEYDNPETELGPDIDWQGPTEKNELQGWLRPEPDIQDVGFLMRAIERAASVCRVDVFAVSSPGEETLISQGTGFLISPRLLLTNYHVLMPNDDADLEGNARHTFLRFGNVTAADGTEEEGISYKLDTDNPILKSSPINELDYVLLKVEEEITKNNEIQPLPISQKTLFEGMPMNLLQHPGGAPLKLALSGNGVDKVISEKGLVQYSTRAAGGSSGAPCFNDDWEVVALHHAQRSRSFGAIREGIIFHNIYQEIKEYFE